MRRGTSVALVAGAALTVLALVLVYLVPRPGVVMYVTGAVLRDDPDPGKQRPIAQVEISVKSGPISTHGVSDAAGYFRLRLRPPIDKGRLLRLTFQHPRFRPIEISGPAQEEIHVIRMKPQAAQEATPLQPGIPIANVRLRYAVKSTATVDIGSEVRTIRIANTGNVPCEGRPPCSPDGKWKAAVATLELDAGPGKQFRNARVSCIAGPCPFTRIDSDEYSRAGRVVRASIRNWSDLVVYLLEAEVSQTMVSEVIRYAYPAIFGRSMNFTLPPPAQGPSIEAEVGGADIVYPLGPSLKLSWAVCRADTGEHRTKLYRCELKPEYRFK
jgi:hypothetical protein